MEKQEKDFSVIIYILRRNKKRTSLHLGSSFLSRTQILLGKLPSSLSSRSLSSEGISVRRFVSAWELFELISLYNKWSFPIIFLVSKGTQICINIQMALIYLNTRSKKHFIIFERIWLKYDILLALEKKNNSYQKTNFRNFQKDLKHLNI